MFGPNLHLLADLVDVLRPSNNFVLWWLSRIHSEEFTHLTSHFLVALFVLQLPHFNFLVFSLSDQPLVLLLGLDDDIAAVFIGLLCFGPIWVDADGVSEPARVAPISLDEAARQGALLEDFGLVPLVRLDAHEFQVAGGILFLDRLQKGLVQLAGFLPHINHGYQKRET